MRLNKNYTEIDFFFSAIEQEYDIALKSSEQIGRCPEAAMLIGPSRAFYFQNKILHKKLRFFIRPIILILTIIILPIYTAIFLFKNLNFKKSHECFLPKKIYLHISSDKYAKKVPTHEGKPDTIFLVPFHSIPACQWEKKIRLEELTSNSDVYKSLKLTLMTFFRLLKVKKWYLILYCLMGPNWYLLFKVLKKQAVDEIWLSNHYDRWAILVEHLNTSTVIVPHGSLVQTYYRIDGNYRYPYESNFKLHNVKKIFLIDSTSEADFKALLLNFNCRPVFIPIPSSLKIKYDIFKKSNKTLVLIIGSPAVAFRLKEILNRINTLHPKEFEIVYRPHPRELPINPKNYPKGLNIFPPHDFIPNADLVIDYGSSLIGEIMKISSAEIVGWNIYDPASIEWIIANMRIKKN